VVDGQQWQAVFVFLQRAWFGRAWIIQEVAFDRKVFLFCGGMCTPFMLLTQAAQFLIASEWWHQLPLIPRLPRKDTYKGNGAIKATEMDRWWPFTRQMVIPETAPQEALADRRVHRPFKPIDTS
jgi:hypothetical protein